MYDWEICLCVGMGVGEVWCRRLGDCGESVEGFLDGLE